MEIRRHVENLVKFCIEYHNHQRHKSNNVALNVFGVSHRFKSRGKQRKSALAKKNDDDDGGIGNIHYHAFMRPRR